MSALRAALEGIGFDIYEEVNDKTSYRHQYVHDENIKVNCSLMLYDESYREVVYETSSNADWHDESLHRAAHMP